jgi:hypothetical protein
MPSATKETPTSSRQDIWAKFRYGTAPSKVQKTYMGFPDEQMRRTKKEEKYIQLDQ